jgi:PKD repeat protein
MKTLFLRMCLLFCTTLLLPFLAKSDCVPSYTYSITGLTVTFTNTTLDSMGTTTRLSYIWNFSNGITSTLRNPVITFPTAGPKSVTLTIIDSSIYMACSASRSDSFTLVAPPSALCSASFTKTISGKTVTFTNTTLDSMGTTRLSYFWNFGDGITSTLRNPVITFPTAGPKSVTLTIIDTLIYMTCSASRTDTFTLVAPPSSLCSASFTKTISGKTVTFTNTTFNSIGSTTGLVYFWDFGGGITSSLRDPVITFPTAGVKSATLTILDSTIVPNCSASYTDSFTVTAPPTGPCSASFTQTTSGLTVTFNNTSTNIIGTPVGLIYSWTFNGGITSSQQNPVITFPSGGLKSATLTIIDSTTITGCTSSHTDTFTLTATVNHCAASFTKTISGLTVSFNNTSLNTNGSSSGLSYAWNFGDGSTSSLKNPVKTYSTYGAKTVILSISDSAQGCNASIVDSFVIAPPAPLCDARFSLAVDTAHPFSFFILNTSIILPASTFFWDFGDGTTSTSATPTHTYSSFGVYLICLTVSDTLCTSTFCDSVGMDSSGTLFKSGKFGFRVLDYTTMSTTGIKNTNHDLSNVTVYPNPGSSDIHLDFLTKESSLVTIELTDLAGKTILNNTIQSKAGENSETIDISALNPSIYFVRIITPTGYKVLKLVKN